MDQMKMLNQLRKAQKSLKNEIVEVEAGDGAVTVQITGELKIKSVKIDPALHKEVLDRYATLDIAPYKGFVNPVYTPVRDNEGRITDIKVDYTEGYADQMLRYGRDYHALK
jgi:hypothetical protein